MVAETARLTLTLGTDGQISIPPEISDATGIRPGGQVQLSVVGPGRFEVAAADLGEADATDEIEPMTLAEAFTRFVVEGPVDMRRLREEWEADAADEVIAELERNARRPD